MQSDWVAILLGGWRRRRISCQRHGQAYRCCCQAEATSETVSFRSSRCVPFPPFSSASLLSSSRLPPPSFSFAFRASPIYRPWACRWQRKGGVVRAVQSREGRIRCGWSAAGAEKGVSMGPGNLRMWYHGCAERVGRAYSKRYRGRNESTVRGGVGREWDLHEP